MKKCVAAAIAVVLCVGLLTQNLPARASGWDLMISEYTPQQNPLCVTNLGNKPWDNIVLGYCALPFADSQELEAVYVTNGPESGYELEFRNGLCITIQGVGQQDGYDVVEGTCVAALTQIFVLYGNSYGDISWSGVVQDYYGNNLTLDVNGGVEKPYTPIVTSYLTFAQGTDCDGIEGEDFSGPNVDTWPC